MKIKTRKFFKLELMLAITMVLSILYVVLSTQETANAQIRDNTVRLHIIAQSDSEEDQALKLKVRDAILEQSPELFANTDDKEEALLNINDNIQRIEEIATQTLRENGCDLPVTAGIVRMDFSVKRYEDRAVMPAGEYDALRVVIGDGAGQNWWCVMFPPLCVPTASSTTTTAEDVYGEDGAAEIVPADEIELKFKIVEIYDNIVNFFGGGK